mmetsp:Transcript_13438/g.32774  ORF Transcript_13438/g.32774 Transcript_13438/m.32774 type:complete len:118 (-) Transcript_13438:204-557(-)
MPLIGIKPLGAFAFSKGCEESSGSSVAATMEVMRNAFHVFRDARINERCNFCTQQRFDTAVDLWRLAYFGGSTKYGGFSFSQDAGFPILAGRMRSFLVFKIFQFQATSILRVRWVEW